MQSFVLFLSPEERQSIVNTCVRVCKYVCVCVRARTYVCEAVSQEPRIDLCCRMTTTIHMCDMTY